MPDEIDVLTERGSAFDKEFEDRIAQARAGAPKYLSRRFCLNCGEPTFAGAAFCDLDCQGDYEARGRMQGLASATYRRTPS